MSGGAPLIDEGSASSALVAGNAEITLDYLYRRYAVALTNFCRGRLNGDSSEAEDACHETILKAYRALPRFRPGPLWPWLATIAANVCIDIHRKRSRLVRLDGDLPRASAAGPEFEAARRGRIRLVRQAIKQLPRRYQTLIRQREFEGLSYREMAELHGVKVATVATALRRARGALGKAVEKLARAQGGWPMWMLILLGAS